MSSQEPSTAGGDATLLRGFVARVEAAYRRRALLVAASDAALPLACLVALALLWSPWLAAWLALAGALLLGILLLPALLRARRAARAAVLELHSAPRHLGDGLATWREVDGSAAAATPMAQWLAHDLGAAVRALTAARQPPLRRRALGRVRYLAPVVAVLLLIWWLRPDLSLPVPGLASPPSGGKGSGGGTVASGPEPRPSNLPPPPTPEPEPPPEPGIEEPPAPPAPLLDLPALPSVVVPEFTGDGPTRRALAQRALAAVDDAAAALAAAGAGAGAPQAPPPQQEQFARAAERALASRHVPAAERAFVRRYFALLQEPAK